MPKLSSRAPSENALSAKSPWSRARPGHGFRRFEFLLWLAPALLLVGALTYLPILTELVLSFFAADGFSMPQFVGFANYTQAIGLTDFKRDWLGAPETAFPAVIFVDLWKWTGFHVVIYLAGLQSIPGELYEAAALDGASRWQMLWRITLPLLKPFTAVNVVIASLGAFSVFDLIYVMTQGGPFKSTNVAIVEVYLQAFQFNQFGYAAALSVLVLLLITGLSLGLLRIFRTGPAEREA